MNQLPERAAPVISRRSFVVQDPGADLRASDLASPLIYFAVLMQAEWASVSKMVVNDITCDLIDWQGLVAPTLALAPLREPG